RRAPPGSVGGDAQPHALAGPPPGLHHRRGRGNGSALGREPGVSIRLLGLAAVPGAAAVVAVFAAVGVVDAGPVAVAVLAAAPRPVAGRDAGRRIVLQPEAADGDVVVARALELVVGAPAERTMRPVGGHAIGAFVGRHRPRM